MLNLDAVSVNADWLRLAGRAREAGLLRRGAVAKEWDESLYERDENGRFTSDGGGGGANDNALPVPDWVSPNNLVSATAPYVGLSKVARETASRIRDIKPLKVEKDALGQKVTTYTATYTSKSGKEFNLVAAEKISEDGFVTGRVVAQAEDSEYELRQDLYAPESYSQDAPFDLYAGDMEYGKTYKQIEESNVLYSQILAVSAWDKREGIGTAMLEFARATSTTAIMHSTNLSPAGEAFSEVVKEWNEELYERDENGRFTSGGGGGNGDAIKSVTVQALDKQMAAIKREQKKTEGAVVSPELTAIIRAQGFDAKPQVVSSESELTGTVMYRGVNTGYMDEVPEGLTGESLAEQFKTGDLRVGVGVFGDGVYFAAQKDLAQRFAYGPDANAPTGSGAMIVGALSPDAKVFELDRDTPDTQINASIEKMANQIPREIVASYVAGSGDMSRVLALNGYDALHVTGSNIREQYVIYNRGMMQVVG